MCEFWTGRSTGEEHFVLTLVINPPHPFSIVLNRFWYFTQDLLRTIEPLENNRKWVWYVYKQHNNIVVGLVFEITRPPTRLLSYI